jgi:hypothetical protein
MFSHISLHKKTLFNEYMWMNLSKISAKTIYIAICYFVPINSTLYKKNNLDKSYPYNGLEHDIHWLRNKSDKIKSI